MEESVEIPVTIRGEERVYTALVQAWRYGVRFLVDVDGVEVTLERDDAGEFRAVLPEGFNGKTPDKEAIAAIKKATEIYESDKDHYFLPQQFDNPANPAIHESTTGPEIWNDTDGAIDVLVSGVGTGGTLTGVSRFIKKTKGRQITTVAVEPTSSPVISQTKEGKPLTPSPHKIQGLGAGFVPKNLDLEMVDRVELVSNEEAVEMARRLSKEEGILSGISCGAAAAVAVRLAKLPEFAGKTIVTVLPDSGERYISTILFEGIGQAAGA